MKVSFSNIINSTKDLILYPKSFWISRKEEQDSQLKIFLGFLLPYLLVISIAVFLGEFFRSSHFYIGFALLKSLRVVVLFLLQYFLAVFFTNELIKTFGGEKNIEISRNLVAYSLTPFLLVSIVTGLFPFLYVIDILGLFSFYIFWVGVKELLVFPENKRTSYTLITIVTTFFVFSFLSIILSKLLTAYY
jgi:hypothetical protein